LRKKNKILVNEISDKDILFYLETRNQKINIENSISKKKINILDHFIWWFGNDNMKAYTVSKDNKKLFIMTEIYYKVNKVDIVVPGLMTCTKEYSIIDLLWTIRWQKENIDKVKKKLLCSISVPKDNFFSNKQAKYFGFKRLNKSDKYFMVLKKLFNFKKGMNYYFRLINEKI
jgi:hypothetical protein